MREDTTVIRRVQKFYFPNQHLCVVYITYFSYSLSGSPAFDAGCVENIARRAPRTTGGGHRPEGLNARGVFSIAHSANRHDGKAGIRPDYGSVPAFLFFEV